MTRKNTLNASVLRGIAPFIAVLTVMIALAALAQTRGSILASGKAAGSLRKKELAAGPMSQGPLVFMPVVGYATGGSSPASVAVADVNGDGKPDLLVANSNGPSSVGVLLGNGDGTFQPAVSYATLGAGSVTVADVNDDGKPDLLVASPLPPVVGVLLGNGDGTFQAVVSYATGGRGPGSVAVADVSGDGKPDLVVANCGNGCQPGLGSVGVLLGNGDGTFKTAVTYASGGDAPGSIAALDVNGDGKPDVLVANRDSNSVGVLLGNGDGTLKTAVTYASGGGGAFSLSVADVNGDGQPDLLVANYYLGSVGVLLGNGDGTFQSVVLSDSGGSGPYATAVADLNGDGNPDVVVALLGFSTVGAMLGNGDGTFEPAVAYDPGGGQPVSVAGADVNGDGLPDIIVATESGEVVGVLLNNYGAPPTTTSIVSSVNPVTVKQVVTYTATVTPQAGGTLQGTVRFLDGDAPPAIVPLANNQAAYSTSYKAIIAHAITATYSGDLHKGAGSASDTLTENVRGTSKTVVTTSGSPSMFGQSVTFAAKVTSTYGAIPDGEIVTFYDGTNSLSSVPLAGGVATYATSALSAKIHTIKATYSGDAKLAPSTGTVQQVVNKYPTTTSLSSSLNPSQFGQPVTFTAHVTSTGPAPTGSVRFLDGTTGIGLATLSGGVAKLTKSNLAVDSHSITAHYNGNAASSTSTSAVVNQVVQ